MPHQNGPTCQVDFIGGLSLTPMEGVLLVVNDTDYVHACRRLSEQSGAKESVRVWVRNRNHFLWLKDFLEQIKLECLFEEKTVRHILADRWNVTVPDWLDDQVILEQHLLELDVATQPRDTFVNRLLVHFLSETFRGEVLGTDNLSGVITALVASIADGAFKDYPILHTCLESKCKEWAAGSSEKWAKGACDRIPEDFDDLWSALSCWSILHGYPGKLVDYALTAKNAAWVRLVPPGCIAEIPLQSNAREQLLTQIDVFFDHLKPQVKSSEDFRKIVGWTSGRLLQELKHISDLLRSNQFAVSTEDVQAVQDKFESCPGVTAGKLRSLKNCVQPAHPALLDEDTSWSAQEWIRWTEDEYLPYRTWQLHNNHYDEELEKTVQRFSAWYVDEYPVVQKDPDLSLIHSLGDAGKTEGNKALSVILLIDCLPLQFGGLLDDALRNYGFSMHERTYRFAPLPTTTMPNKAIVLGGQWGCHGKDYESVLKARAEQDWGGREVLYVSTLKALSELKLPDEPAVVVLNFVDSDDLLHEDVESKNTTYEEELYRLFNRVGETVRQLCDAWIGEKEHFIIHVATDHGACRILDEEKHSFDSGLVNKLFPSEKYRFSSVDAAKVQDIPENLWGIGHKFQKPFYADDRVYFVPKGHNTVRLPGKGRGFLHGGATPEEVIVPTAVYKTIKVPWKHPFARFLGLNLERETGRAKFYIQRVVSMELELQNPNSSAVRVIRASILAPDTDLKGCEAPSIKPGQTGILRLECYFKKAALGRREMLIEVVYEIGGESHTLTVPLDCEFKSAVSTGFSLKDLS